MFGYTDILQFVIVLAAIVVSIILHEIAHGVVALWNGDTTAKDAGRLTLNPVSHFDLLGFLMLVVCRFGYAKPVPVNPYNFRNRKTGMITVSLAGISVNILLAFIFYPLRMVTYTVPYLYTFNVYMVLINLNLAVFNLLPLYPLDGYRLVNCFVPSENKVMRFLRAYSRYILLILLALGVFQSAFSLPLYFDPLSWLIRTVSYFLMDVFGLFWGLFF